MKLIKITNDHYVVVDDSEIKDTDYVFNTLHKVIAYGPSGNFYDKKITHSTQPVEPIVTEDSFKSYDFIPLQEVKELIGEVDVEKKVKEYYKKDTTLNNPSSFKAGYNQALEDNKEKKYTDEDIDKAISWAINSGRDGKVTITDIDNFIQSLQPKTEWEVELMDGKLKLKNNEIN